MGAPQNLLLVAAFVLTASVDLFAQQEPPVAPGDRVRVTAPTIDPDTFVGTVVAMGADACVLEVEGHAGPLPLPLASVTSLEVSRGQKSRTLWGAGIGLVAGGAAGAAIGSASSRGDEWSGLGTLAYAAGGAWLGLLFGAAIGAVIRTERWEVVDLQSVRLSLTPLGRSGVAVSVSVSF
ncbi:MAG: hypothetical protein JSW46_06165 [Gemmatimonadota bacterium]|nr:MAG: hypothetical protein JSW46_06165 [Gemmatimonadota bacterium]